MRKELLNNVKNEIKDNLKAHLLREGIALYIATNDNIPLNGIAVILEGIDHTDIHRNKRVTEIRILLGILGKPSECDALIDGLYTCLQPHHLTLNELNVLLMSIHIVSTQKLVKRRTYRKSVIRYIMEEEIMVPETQKKPLPVGGAFEYDS